VALVAHRPELREIALADPLDQIARWSV